jgi:hypothetical protein
MSVAPAGNRNGIVAWDGWFRGKAMLQRRGHVKVFQQNNPKTFVIVYWLSAIFYLALLSHSSKITNGKSSITDSKSLFLTPIYVSWIDFDGILEEPISSFTLPGESDKVLVCSSVRPTLRSSLLWKHFTAR